MADAPKQWHSHPGSSPHFQGQIYDEVTGATVAISYSDEGGRNAAHIVKAVNSHDDLLEALEDAQSAVREVYGPDSAIAKNVSNVIARAGA